MIMAIIIHVMRCQPPPWFNRNFKLAVNNQNIYSFNRNIRSIKAHKLNLRLCSFEKSVEGGGHWGVPNTAIP